MIDTNLLFEKFNDNLIADKLFITSNLIPFYKRVSFILNKYSNILSNSRNINYLGANYKYDNRFGPVILEFYPFEIKFLNDKVDFANIKTVIDIGANTGQWSYTLKSLFPHLIVFSFEPNKKIYKLLETNSSHFANWKIFNYGIASESKQKIFYYPQNATAAGSLVKGAVMEFYNSKQILETKINCIKLNKINLKKLKIPQNIDLIKIDVEGYELEVLKSLKDIHFS